MRSADVAAPELVSAAAGNLSDIHSTIIAANAVVSGTTTELMAAGSDE
ncbi:MAG: PE family protein [Mycobacteriaceae bacterium]|nr:PE family protein [Mycobacteriaceae bacterium]